MSTSAIILIMTEWHTKKLQQCHTVWRAHRQKARGEMKMKESKSKRLCRGDNADWTVQCSSVVWQDRESVSECVLTVMSAQCRGELWHSSHHPHRSEAARPHALDMESEALLMLKVVTQLCGIHIAIAMTIEPLILIVIRYWIKRQCSPKKIQAD